jgi:hypothetical protein
MHSQGITPKKRCIVVSQPMYFPWIGILQQIKKSDVFVYYNDVQFSRGFFNRVQIKTLHGTKWMSVPLSNLHRGQLINEVAIDNSSNWKSEHLKLLERTYATAPYCDEMLVLVESVFSKKIKFLGELAIASTNALLSYYPNINRNVDFYKSSDLNVIGTGSQRLIDICQKMNASDYLTGHGAKNYLDHNSFDSKKICVDYIDYELDCYSQIHGEFTPYVSTLDLIANCGKKGEEIIKGRKVPWREFISRGKGLKGES